MKEKNYAMNTPVSMKALLAFESSVRLGSFVLAAEALHVTPGAIGQQIKKLEEQLGFALFIRDIRKLTVTGQGMAYYQLIAPALAQLLDAGRKVRERTGRRLCLSMPPGVAAKWFSPRMPQFIAAFPDVDLHLNASTTLVMLERDNVDLAIRYFDGHAQQSALCRLMWNDECRVYAQPALLSARQINTPADIGNATLLHTTLHPDWTAWLNCHTPLTPERIASLNGIHFDQTLLAIEAAKQGQGLLLCHPKLVEEELTQGTLIRAFDHVWHSGKGFWLLINPQKKADATVNAVAQWLLRN